MNCFKTFISCFLLLAFFSCKKIKKAETTGQPYIGEWMTHCEGTPMEFSNTASIKTITSDSIFEASSNIGWKYILKGDTILYTSKNNSGAFETSRLTRRIIYQEKEGIKSLVLLDEGATISLEPYGSSEGITFGGFVVFLLLFIVGIIGTMFLANSLKDIAKMFASRTWPIVKGKPFGHKSKTSSLSYYGDYKVSGFDLPNNTVVSDSSGIFDYTKYTKTSKTYYISFFYEINGKKETCDSQNGGPNFQTTMDADKYIKSNQTNSVDIHIHPTTKEAYFDFKIGRFLLNLLLMLVFLALSLAFGASLETLINWFGFEGIRINNTINIILVVPLILAILFNFMPSSSKAKK